MGDQDTKLREQIRARYAEAAVAVTSVDTNAHLISAAGCCGRVEVDPSFGVGLYSDGEQSEVPAEAVAASLGCGNPTAVAELRRVNTSSTWVRAAGSTCCYPHGE
ncbi:noc6 domain protein [Mycobacterium xenopi 3993]|nr:noc6 domain protein [Mycobacterium xenopi 3993]